MYNINKRHYNNVIIYCINKYIIQGLLFTVAACPLVRLISPCSFGNVFACIVEPLLAFVCFCFWCMCKEVVLLHCRLMSWNGFESILKPSVLVTSPIICVKKIQARKNQCIIIIIMIINFKCPD